MTIIPRRAALALIGVAGGTVASALLLRKFEADRPRVVTLRHAVSDENTDDLDDLSNLKPTVPPVAAPNIVFSLADGAVRHLADFRGRGMLVNFWATWCRPCVAEMPALAKLSAAVAPVDVAVMPLSDDRGGAAVVRRFYDEHGITALPILLDTSGDAARAFNVRGFPTSILIDPRGREQARLEGAADWSSPEAVTLVSKLAMA
jgi:thiol-disulfide isomerase/thioredoxin